ncbi:hypothetical protein EI555_014030, partial [Monodon monoceros]
AKLCLFLSGQLPAVSVVLRGLVPGVPVTWMGPGFARVLAGPGLRFAVGNIPIPMDFAVAIRYEAQLPFTPLPRERSQCTRDPTAKASAFSSSFQVHLIPQINSLENFCSKQDLDEYHLHNCVEIASPATVTHRAQWDPTAADWKASASVSLVMSLPPSRLREHCNRTTCDQVTGRCPCHGEVAGCYCDRCLESSFGFPNCRPCLCNGFTVMLQLWRFYNWEKLPAVLARVQMFPQAISILPIPVIRVLGAQMQSAIVFKVKQHIHTHTHPSSHSLFLSPSFWCAVWRMLCWFLWKSKNFGSRLWTLCLQQHVDVTDPESCSPVTGEDLKCLHNTQGPSCQLCRPGVVDASVITDLPPKDGSVLPGCSCHPSGVSPSECPPGGGACLCDADTGTRPCMPNVTGQACDHRADGCWNVIAGRRCQPWDPCDCNGKDSQKHICDQDVGTCHCREGVSGPRCDRCAQGHSQKFPACLRCHLCFDPWDHTISSLSKAVQGLIRLAANMEDKRETLPVCEADFKGLRENMSEIERIWRHPVFSSGEFLKVKDYHDSVRKEIIQLSDQRKTVYEFQDLKERRGRTRNKVNLLLEDLQEEIDLHSRARNASIMGKRENAPQMSLSGQELIKSIIPQRASRSITRALSAEKKTNETTSIIDNSEKNRNDLLTILDTLTSKENLSLEKLKQIQIPDIQTLHEKLSRLLTLSRNTLHKAQEAEFVIRNLNSQVQGLKNQIKNISKLAEVSKNNALQLSEKLRNMKNQSVSEEEKMSLLIKKLKMFLLGKSNMKTLSDSTTFSADGVCEIKRFVLNSRELLVKDKNQIVQLEIDGKSRSRKAANVLLNLDKMLNKLQQVQITQVRADSTITQLTAQITKIKKNALQRAHYIMYFLVCYIERLSPSWSFNQQQAENQARETELDVAKQQSALEGGLARLQTKLQRNRDEAVRVAAQAESAQRQAGGLEEANITHVCTLYKYFLMTGVLLCYRSLLSYNRARTDKGNLRENETAKRCSKLAADTEDKIRRITDLETKIQVLNLSRQEKADQLKQLEGQVIAIKKEIIEQENKYATCYS